MSVMKWIAVWAATICGLTVTTFAQPTTAPKATYKIDEIRIGPWALDGLSPVCSSDGKHFAYWTATNGGKKQFVVVDGQQQPEYDEINQSLNLIFSPDSKRVIYEARKGEKWLVVDGQAGPEYDEVGGLIFSLDGKHIAYTGKIGSKMVVVVDGQTGPEYDLVDNPLFSPDGNRVAYGAAKSGKEFLVIDGQAGAQYDAIANARFSPDGKTIAFLAAKGEKRLVVVNGKEGADYDRVADLNLSADGKHFAYRALMDGKQLVVCDGKAGEEFDGIGELCFSPGGEHFAYGAIKGTKQLVVVDGQAGTEYDHIGGHTLTFSPDGRHVAYLAKWGDKDEKQFVVLDGKEQKVYDEVISTKDLVLGFRSHFGVGSAQTTAYHCLRFSPDSSHLCYVAKSDDKQFLVCDGRESKPYDGLFPRNISFSPKDGTPVFRAGFEPNYMLVVNGIEVGPYAMVDWGPIWSDDGRRWAYSVCTGDKHHVVTDAGAEKEYTEIGQVVFSPDGKHLAYPAKNGEKYLVVLDGQAGAKYDRIIESLTFNSDGVLKYMAVRENSLYSVKCNPMP